MLYNRSCLSVLHIVICICYSQAPNLSLLLPFPFGNHKFSMSLSLVLFCKWVHLYQHFFRFHIQVILCDICLYLTSRTMIISRSIHVAADGFILFFLWMIIWYTYTHTHICPLFIHSSIDGHLGCFHVLAIVKSVYIQWTTTQPYKIMK